MKRHLFKLIMMLPLLCLFACGSGKSAQTETEETVVHETTEETEIEEENTESEGEEEPAEEEKTAIEESDTFAVGKVEDGKYINEFIGFSVSVEKEYSDYAEEHFHGYYRSALDGEAETVAESENGLVELYASNNEIYTMLTVYKQDTDPQEYANMLYDELMTGYSDQNIAPSNENKIDISRTIGTRTWVGYDDFYEIRDSLTSYDGTFVRRTYCTEKNGYVYVFEQVVHLQYALEDEADREKLYAKYRQMMDAMLN